MKLLYPKKTKYFVLLLILSLLQINLVAQLTTIPTFECISIYWSPEGGGADKDVLVKFRETGTTEWHNGLNMKYNPQNPTYDGGDYRGSLVNLKPDTEYEIELTLEGTNTQTTYIEKTWPENFPIGKTIYPGSMSKQLDIMKSDSGSATGYVLYDGQGDTIDVDNNYDACIHIRASYVIIRNFVLTGGRKWGVYLEDNVHDVVIENCDISNWGEIMEDGWGTQQGAIHSTPYGSYDCGIYESDLTRIVVQRNKIHNPRSDANSWAEGRGDPVNYHPIGPQAVFFVNSAGNNVIRYNEVWSDSAHYYNDIIGGSCNQDWRGYPGPDSDIYGNYLANCWDEPIEAEGGGRNVRIWGNYVEEGYLPIAAASTRLGPMYVWRNVSGRTYTPPGSKYGDIQPFFKQEYFEDGFKYLFNNTILQPNDHGAGGIATKDGSSGSLQNFITRNNIIHVRSLVKKSILSGIIGYCDYDYDFCSGTYPAGYEVNGIDGIPTYSGTGFDKATMTGDFSLQPGTPGNDDGVVVPNFIEEYEGAAPDMGASEVGGDVIEYGVDAYRCTDQVELTSSAVNGQVNPPPGKYCRGSKIQFTGTPDRGYKFEKWGGDFSGTENPVSYVMNDNLYLEAYFTPLPVYTLTTNVKGGGHVSASANGDYYEGDKVRIIAFPNWQEQFLRWEGDLNSTENPVTVTMDSNTVITAVFTGESSDINEELAEKYSFKCFPNPFSGKMTIRFELDKSEKVNIAVYNLYGQKEKVILDETLGRGEHLIRWNSDSSKNGALKNGTYFIQFAAGDEKPYFKSIILNR